MPSGSTPLSVTWGKRVHRLSRLTASMLSRLDTGLRFRCMLDPGGIPIWAAPLNL